MTSNGVSVYYVTGILIDGFDFSTVILIDWLTGTRLSWVPFFLRILSRYKTVPQFLTTSSERGQSVYGDTIKSKPYL